YIFFFFSSRRRHTRFSRDWSSDVCSSDLIDQRFTGTVLVVELRLGDTVVDVDRREGQLAALLELVEPHHARRGLLGDAADRRARSEERRVGKGCRCGGWRDRWKKT